MPKSLKSIMVLDRVMIIFLSFEVEKKKNPTSLPQGKNHVAAYWDKMTAYRGGRLFFLLYLLVKYTW